MPTFEAKEPQSRATVLARGDVGVAHRDSLPAPIGGTERSDTAGATIISRVGPDSRRIYSLSINDTEFDVLLARMIVAKMKGVTPLRWTRSEIADRLRSYAYELELDSDG